jgi:hypothetical protein
MSAACRPAGVTHGQRSALRLLQTDRSDGTASPSFAPTTNVPAHNNDRIDTQSERVTGVPCGERPERICADRARPAASVG